MPASGPTGGRIDAPGGFGHDRRARSRAPRSRTGIAFPDPLLAFILRRILQSVAVMAVVAFIAFGLFNFTGDPVAFMVGQDATARGEGAARAASSASISRSPCSSCASSATRCTATSGCRCARAGPVSTLLKERLPATLELSVAAALLALVVGIPLGVYTALRRDTWLAHLLLAGSLVGVSACRRS